MNKSESRWDGSEHELDRHDQRPISILAIVSFLAGLPAGFAYALPGLSLLLVVSLATGIAAIFSNRREPKSLIWLAYIGVFVATVGTTWNLTTRSLYQNHMVAKGEQFAEQWIKLVIDDQIYEALCLRMEYYDRPLEGINLAEYFERSVAAADSADSAMKPADMKDQFLDSQTVQSFLASGKETTYRPLPDKTRFFETTGWFEVEAFFDVAFLLDDGHGPRRKSQIISVTARRIQHAAGAHWQISNTANNSSPDRPTMETEGDDPSSDGSLPPIPISPLD